MRHIITLTRSDIRNIECGVVIHSILNDIEVLIKLEKDGYIPTCPMGYDDCIYDPAYVKQHHPEWYEHEYGDISPEEASSRYCSNNCDEYDWEDK